MANPGRVSPTTGVAMIDIARSVQYRLGGERNHIPASDGQQSTDRPDYPKRERERASGPPPPLGRTTPSPLAFLFQLTKQILK